MWNKAALPGILYGCEVLPIRKQELRKLDSEAAAIGKFILQLPKNSTNVTAQLVAGIETVEYHYYKQVLGYQTRIEKMDEGKLAYRVYKYVMDSPQDCGYKQCHTRLQKTLNGKSLVEWYVDSVNNQKNLNVSSCYILPLKSAPDDGHVLHLHDYDELSKSYVTMNSGLGNRGPVKGFKQHKWCRLCEKRNIKEKLNEHHILFKCLALKRLQDRYGMTSFKQNSGQLELGQISKTSG